MPGTSDSSLPKLDNTIMPYKTSFVNNIFKTQILKYQKIYAIKYITHERKVNMASDNTQSSFRRGVMSLVILTLLKREDMYGYQLVQETNRSSGGKLITQEGSLYPVLYKLLDQGLISDRKVQVGRRMTRIYYHLEPAGEQRQKELAQEYKQITQGVFQIIERTDNYGELAACSAVSVEDLRDDAGELEPKEEGFIPRGGIHPGVCF